MLNNELYLLYLTPHAMNIILSHHSRHNSPVGKSKRVVEGEVSVVWVFSSVLYKHCHIDLLHDPNLYVSRSGLEKQKRHMVKLHQF